MEKVYERSDMKETIRIDPIDSVYIRVTSEPSVEKELSSFFTFTVPGHKFVPAYRKRLWDGKIKLYHFYKKEIYAGLLNYILEFARDRNYEVVNNITEPLIECDTECVQKFCSSLNLYASGEKITPHQHQIDAILYALNKKRSLLLSPTGSGKSLVLYVLTRYLLNTLSKDKKILLLVPTVSLVAQMYSDFKDYSYLNKWNVKANVHTIHAGQDTNTHKRVVISTWQSIYKLPESYFAQFDCILGDECHLYKSKSLIGILSKLKTCQYKIGTTGTLDGTLTHKLVLEGLFGNVQAVTSTSDLMKKNLLSPLEINCIILNHSENSRKAAARLKYSDEVDWIVGKESRNNFICDLALNLKGNTLVLFQFVEKHGKILYELFQKKSNNLRNIFFISGNTEKDERELIRKIVEKETNAIIVASYGTCSTGISIRKLHNIVFSSSSKSRIRVLQSIGRQLRKSDQKEIAKLYDIADDLTWKSWKNHTFRHFNERLKIYDSENFNYKKIMIPLD
jgi:superfamily II DNA or RNA helicase